MTNLPVQRTMVSGQVTHNHGNTIRVAEGQRCSVKIALRRVVYVQSPLSDSCNQYTEEEALC